MPIVCLLLAAVLMAGEPSAADLYRRGREAEKKGHMAAAYVFYSEAYAKEPNNQTYWLRSQAVRSRAALEADLMPKSALTGAERAALDTPKKHFDPPSARDLADAKKPLPPTELTALPARKDFNLRESSDKLYHDVAKAFGLECVFDGDYEPLPSIRFEMTGVDYRDALNGLQAATGTFIIPLTSKVFMVVKDTPQKRKDLEPQVVVAVPLPEPVSQQDFNSMITAVQQTFAIQHVGWDSSSRVVVLRGPISQVLPARAMLRDLLRPRGQVMIEFKLLEVSLNDALTYGVNFPNLFPIYAMTTWMNNPLSVTQNVAGLLGFGAGNTLFGIGIVMPQLVLQMTNSTGNLVYQSELRALDGQPATLHVGDRYPIMTAGYYGPSSFYGANTYTPPPSFNFEDLGLEVKVTPHIFSEEAATMEIDASFKILTGQSVNGIPVIANRALKSTVQLKMGAWAMVAGLLDRNDTQIITGLPGISHIPVLGTLTETHEHDRADTQELLLMRPRLLTPPPADLPTHAYWVGSENRPRIPI